MKTTKQYVYRSSATGKFVSEKFAKKHPKTTYRDTIKKTK